MYWRQRSRISWLAHGDRNSKYFHSCASIRRDKNHIRGLVSSHGDWCTEKAQMIAIIEDYFTNLFASNNPTMADRRHILDCVTPVIDEHMNSILSASFSAAEIQTALFDMHPDKTPGSDGMSVLFYQKFWSSVGGEVIEAVQRILNDEHPLDAWNDTIVTLIPKIKSPMTMKDFRPISLCNVCYKIVARALTNRLRPILKQTVNDFQSAFIQDRLITDNIIMGFETIHWIRSRKGGHKGYAVLKLDMSKAYDRVEWSFLEGIMLQLGFSHIWVEKVMRCVRSVRYSFCVNGELSGNITPSRGLRQGDPLSPYLFVLCAHGLSSAILSFEARKLIKGVRIAPTCPSITHLFFADDSLLFFQATMESCAGVQQCLLLYEKASGQLINFEKSSLSFSPNTSDGVVESIKTMLAIPVVQNQEVYLGLPIFSARKKRLQFRYLVERVTKRMQGWKRKMFSIGGKETLIKSVIQSIPSYAMSCFRIPTSICKDIERECSNFWWGGDDTSRTMHWKSWKLLCQPKCLGGMGFRHLETFNKALLAKQIWRIIVNPHSLVAKVLKARYFRHCDVMEAQLGSNPSYIWRSLCWCRPLLEKGLHWRVGNGKKIATFADRWIPGVRVQQNTTQNNHIAPTVSTLIRQGIWNEQMVKDLFSPHVVADILSIPLNGLEGEDTRYWSFDPKGQYSVRDGYKMAIGLYDSPANCSKIRLKNWWKFLWSLSLPPKVRIFWWRALHHILPTTRNLQVHHVPTIEVCALCGASIESTSHALFSCQAVRHCWKETQFWTMLKGVCMLDIFDIALCLRDNFTREEFELFAIRTYAVWMDRNRIIHSSDARTSLVNVDWCDGMLCAYHAARASVKSYANMPTQQQSPKVWKAPPVDQLRMDVDAAYNLNSNSFAIGGIVRNNEGQPVLAFGKQILKPPSVTAAELLAIEEGIQMTQNHHLRIHQLTSDSLLGVQAVTCPKEDLGYNGNIVTNISRLLKCQPQIQLEHVMRTANIVAHSLASFACSSSSSFVWKIGEFPSWLVKLVIKDLFSS